MKNFTTLIKESFGIYKQKIKSILMILITGWVLTMVFGILTSLISPESIIEKGGYHAVLLILGIFLFVILLSAFITLSFILLTIKPTGTKLREIFQEVWKKLWQYLWIVALVGFFTTLSFIFFIIPSLIVWVYLVFSLYVFITEEGKGMNALKRSWALVKGNWWKVFGRVFLLNMIFGIIFIILSSINDSLGTIFQYLLMPFNVMFMYLIYLELKKSKEIQVQTQE
jgi:hypothetical protein